MKSKVLYITYDGLLEPLGESQVLSYQEKLAVDYSVFLLSYEKADDLEDKEELSRIQKRITAAGIKWIRLKYHKTPSTLATFFDILFGVLLSIWIVKKEKIDFVHTRSYVPALIGLFLKKVFKIEFIFDMRGFWADERVDGDLWKKSDKKYQVAKYFEKQFFLSATQVISLTYAGEREIRKFSYIAPEYNRISVIPTCADLDKFSPNKIDRTNGFFTLGYLGTATTWYLFEETVKCFSLFLQEIPEAKILIINRGEHDFIKEKLRLYDIPLSSVSIESVTHDQVPALLNKMDASVFFIKPTFSKQSSAPTKLAELLGCGVPCLVNEGVGDMSKIILENNVGAVLKNFDRKEVLKSFRTLKTLSTEDDITERCRMTAHNNFSLNEGVERYSKVYGAIVEQK